LLRGRAFDGLHRDRRKNKVTTKLASIGGKEERQLQRGKLNPIGKFAHQHPAQGKGCEAAPEHKVTPSESKKQKKLRGWATCVYSRRLKTKRGSGGENAKPAHTPSKKTTRSLFCPNMINKREKRGSRVAGGGGIHLLQQTR